MRGWQTVNLLAVSFYDSMTGIGSHTVIVLIVVVVDFGQLLEIDLVAKDAANTTKSFDELVPFTGTIGYKFQRGAKVLIRRR